MARFFRRKSKGSKHGDRFAPNQPPDNIEAVPLTRQDHPDLCDLGRPGVVGESHRQSALRRVLAEEGREVSVMLSPDPDNSFDRNAVRVMVLIGDSLVEAVHVGYLPREDAAAWSPKLRRLPTAVRLEATLAGGTDDKPTIGVFVDDSEFRAPAVRPTRPQPPKRPERRNPDKPPRRRNPDKPTVDEMLTAWNDGDDNERLALWGRIDDVRKGRLLRSLNDWPRPLYPPDPPDSDDLIDFAYEHFDDWQHVIGFKANGDDKIDASPEDRRRLRAAYIAEAKAEDRRWWDEDAAQSKFPGVVALLDSAGLSAEVDQAAVAPKQGGRVCDWCPKAVAEVRARREKARL